MRTTGLFFDLSAVIVGIGLALLGGCENPKDAKINSINFTAAEARTVLALERIAAALEKQAPVAQQTEQRGSASQAKGAIHSGGTKYADETSTEFYMLQGPLLVSTGEVRYTAAGAEIMMEECKDAKIKAGYYERRGRKVYYTGKDGEQEPAYAFESPPSESDIGITTGTGHLIKAEAE